MMMMNNNNNNNNNNKPNIAISECSNCSATADHKWLLHHVRLRGIYRRLCTSCVLKLHPGSFCPTCFDLFETLPPFHRRVICQKCPSISHPNCITSSDDSKAYTCPPCATPNYSFFDVVKKKSSDENGGAGAGGGGGGIGGEVKMIDKKAATVLLCAARIAAASMTKAMGVARGEAERRAREAAMSRKRAREALEHVASVVAKEKARRLKDGLVDGEGSVHVGVKEKARIGGNGNGGKNLAILAAGQQNRIEYKVTVDAAVDSSRKVSPIILDNNGGSREKERVQEDISMKSEALGSPKNGAIVAVKEEVKERASNEDEIVGASLKNQSTVTEIERLENVAHLNNHKAEDEKANNGLLPPHPVGVQLRHEESIGDRKEDTSSK